MKKLAISAFAFASVASLSAQSLFDLAPSAEESESIPLNYTFSASLGIDDNPTPLLANGADSTTYGTAQIGASVLSVTPQTRTEAFARIGVIHYFDDLGSGVDKTTPTLGFGLNFSHQLNQRVRLVSQSYLTQELEPDRETASASLSQTGSYFRVSTSNSIGYRWTDRLGTSTGLSYMSVSYDEESASANDLETNTFFHSFRYQLSPQTVATLNYRYVENDLATSADATNQFILVGADHRFGATTIGVFRAGIQLRDVDGGVNDENLTFEGSLNHRVNERFTVSAYTRFASDDNSRVITSQFVNNAGVNVGVANAFDVAKTLRLGLKGNYSVSEALSLTCGINYSDTDYSDNRQSGEAFLNSANTDVVALNLGIQLQLDDNCILNASYNYEDSGASVDSQEYERNRFSLGVTAAF